MDKQIGIHLQKEEPEKNEPIIEVENLRKVYHNLVAVSDVSFVMYRGEAFGFLGPNGAGKSTVVKMLTGLVTPTEGRVRILGRPVTHKETRRYIGYLPELPNFHKWLQAQEFLEFHAQLYGLSGKDLKNRCSEVLELVGLPGRNKQRLGTFSKGMLQRIGLAQAILNRPKLLFLDELVSGLDPVGQRDMRELLHYLKREGVSIFLNSHQLADVEVLCDRIAIINQGRILKVGAPQSLFNEAVMLKLRVDNVSDLLLERLGEIALAVRQEQIDDQILLIEVQHEQNSADIADIVHRCGARLYHLAPHRQSLDELFFRILDGSSHM